MLKKSVLFKVMGSTEMGLGHINRCLTLVRALPENWRATLMVNNDPLVIKYLENIDLTFETGLGVKLLLESKASLFKSPVDVLIFDQLEKNTPLLKYFKDQFNCLTLALDYFDYKSNDVNIIVNLFNQGDQVASCDGAIKCYEGLEFAIISQKFAAYKNKTNQLKKQIQRVFILMGGGDPNIKTGEALELFKKVAPGVKIDVVIGPLCTHEAAILAMARQLRQTVEIHKNPDNIPELMGKADVAISGCATTFFELSFVGVPAIILSQNPLEDRFCHFLESQGLALYGKESLLDSWNKICYLEQRQALVRVQTETFDGEGPQRILKAAGIYSQMNTITT